MFENVALQVAEVRCYTSTRSQQLAIFLAEFPSWISLFSYPELVGTKNEKRAPMSPCFKKTAVKLREKLLEGRYIVQWYTVYRESIRLPKIQYPLFGI